MANRVAPTQSPLKMPDLRLQARPYRQKNRSTSFFLGGVHIGILEPIALEPLPILRRCEPDTIAKCQPKRLYRRETAPLGDSIQGLVRRFDEFLGSRDPFAHEPGLRGRSRSFAETPQEVPFAHCGLVGERTHVDRLRQVLPGPLEYLLKPAAGPLADR